MRSAFDDLGAVTLAAGPGQDRRRPCADDPNLWFSEHPEQVEAAKRICLTCPMCQRCLTEAITRSEPCGVWGGQLLDHGRVVPRKRGRGRPRKNERAA